MITFLLHCIREKNIYYFKWILEFKTFPFWTYPRSNQVIKSFVVQFFFLSSLPAFCYIPIKYFSFVCRQSSIFSYILYLLDTSVTGVTCSTDKKPKIIFYCILNYTYFCFLILTASQPKKMFFVLLFSAMFSVIYYTMVNHYGLCVLKKILNSSLELDSKFSELQN